MKALRAQTNQTKSSTHVASHRLKLGDIHQTWSTSTNPKTYQITVNNVNLVVSSCQHDLRFNNDFGCGIEAVVSVVWSFLWRLSCVFSCDWVLLTVPEILWGYTEGQICRLMDRKRGLVRLKGLGGRERRAETREIWQIKSERERERMQREMENGWWQAKKDKRDQKRYIYSPLGFESISGQMALRRYRGHRAFACLGLHDNLQGHCGKAYERQSDTSLQITKL